ncbi:MAG: T9SS type A sorting domain-containing protein, partial [Bacteroidetes bacterium]|nr:T9SS type A sorting domain-containing protein [Bacteroidota bacterium]
AHNRSTSTDTTDYPVTLNGRDTIRNCIFWGNVSGSGRQIPRPSGPVLITDNLIQPGGSPTPVFPRTYTFNPLFEYPGTAAAAPFPLNNTYDYRLKAYSAAIDTASNLGSLQGYNTHDLDSNLRVFGTHPDLGAYERIYCTGAPITLSPNPVTVCGSDSVLLVASSSTGGPFYWNGADTAYDSIWVKEPAHTTYHVIYAGLTGNDKIACRSKNSVVINVYPKPYAVVSLQDSTLSVPPLFGGYQWYRNDTLIPGATGPSLLARSNGRYRVMITGFGNTCTDSAVYLLANLKVGTQTLAGNLQIMPNPARDGRFHVSLDAKTPVKEVRVRVSDITGRELLSRQYTNPGSNFFEEVNLGAVAPGIYFVRITADGEAFSRRVVVE